MIAVIFELWPAEGQGNRYFDTATGLREDLAGIDGFISVERFESVSTPGKFVSLSFWRDEAAVAAWRNRPPRRAAQAEGCASVFSDYRLRVAQILRDCGAVDPRAAARSVAPVDGRIPLPRRKDLGLPAVRDFKRLRGCRFHRRYRDQGCQRDVRTSKGRRCHAVVLSCVTPLGSHSSAPIKALWAS